MIWPLHPAKSTPSGPSKKKNSNSNSPTTDICDEFFGNLLHWTNRGLWEEAIGWRIHGGVCPVCVPGLLVSRLAHMAKSAMYGLPRRPDRYVSAPEGWGTKPECVLESTASPTALPSRIVGGSDWVAHTWRCLPCVRPGAAGFAARTHRKKRDVCATRERPRSERRDLALPRCAECLGTKPECALESMVSPITLPSRIGGGSDWVGAYMAVFALCASRGCWFRGSHTSQKAR